MATHVTNRTSPDSKFILPLNMKHHTEGPGLSLAIAQQVVEAHDGIINVESVLGRGTTFQVQIPVVM